MSKTRIKMPTGGRTSGGKKADFSSEEHYLRRLKNRLDGAGQKERKAILAALGFDRSVDPTRAEIDERLRKGVVNFDEILALAGGEKLPGCGSILIFDVASRRQDARTISEDKAVRRLKALGRVNYYWRKRTGKGRKGKDRSGLRKEWPGLVKRLITLNPGDSEALVGAVKSGAMAPEEFQRRLLELASVVALDVRQATKLPGAAKGLEPELIVAHLEQGVIHLHVYARDVDITEPERPRLGLFWKSGSGREKPRLTLNALGISGVAMRRHRSAGHEPPLEIFDDELCRDWRILEVSEKHRADKGLGPCWDVVVSDTVDAYWTRVFSNPELKRLRDEGHAKWATEWQATCAEKKARLKALADSLMKDEMADEARKRADSDLWRDAWSEGLPVANWSAEQESAAAASELESIREFELRADFERRLAESEAREVEAKQIAKDREAALRKSFQNDLGRVAARQKQLLAEAEVSRREAMAVTDQAKLLFGLREVVDAVQEFNAAPENCVWPASWISRKLVCADGPNRMTLGHGFWKLLETITAFPEEAAGLRERVSQLGLGSHIAAGKIHRMSDMRKEQEQPIRRPETDRGVT